MARGEQPTPSGWTFLSNHGQVLICTFQHPDGRLRDIATRVGISERAVFSIINDLEREGYLVRERVGRRNHYVVNRKRPLRHPLQHPYLIGDLLAALSFQVERVQQTMNDDSPSAPGPAESQ